MKSILVSLSIVLVLFTSCSKSAPDVVVPNALSGTTWVATWTQSGTNVIETIKFTGNTTFTDVSSAIGNINGTSSTSGTYTYVSPTVILISKDGLTNTLTVNNNHASSITLDGVSVVFTKQ